MNLIRPQPIEGVGLSAVLGVATVATPDSTRRTVIISTSKGAISLTHEAARYLHGRLAAVLGLPAI